MPDSVAEYFGAHVASDSEKPKHGSKGRYQGKAG